MENLNLTITPTMAETTSNNIFELSNTISAYTFIRKKGTEVIELRIDVKEKIPATIDNIEYEKTLMTKVSSLVDTTYVVATGVDIHEAITILDNITNALINN